MSVESSGRHSSSALCVCLSDVMESVRVSHSHPSSFANIFQTSEPLNARLQWLQLQKGHSPQTHYTTYVQILTMDIIWAESLAPGSSSICIALRVFMYRQGFIWGEDLLARSSKGCVALYTVYMVHSITSSSQCDYVHTWLSGRCMHVWMMVFGYKQRAR